MAAVTTCSDLEPPKIKSDTVFTVSPSIFHDVMGPDAVILVFWMLSFKPTFSLSSFTFKRLFSSSSLSAIRVVSSAYLRLLIFLPAILIPACASSSLAFLMMYSAYKFIKQGSNIQPWHTPCLIWNQSVVPVATAQFPNCWHIECSTFTASSFRIWNSSTGIPSPPLALFIVMLPKAHLILHSSTSSSRWVITPSWLCGS